MYSKHLGPTPQTEALPGQTRNNAGGYSWALDAFGQLRRFLILGSEGGTYYASERKVTKDNLSALDQILAKGFEGGARRAVDLVVEVSEGGLAPKNEPALLALAYCAKKGDDATRAYALAALPKVARIGTHLYHFAEYVNALGGWGRGTRRAVASWFNTKSPDDLAHQVVKYQSRDGWSARDLLRLSHAKPVDQAHDAVYRWVVGKHESGMLPQMIEAFEAVKQANTVGQVVDLIQKVGLPREAIPTQWLTEAPVWWALLPRMGMTALVRNLATMTRNGAINPMTHDGSMALTNVVKRLTDDTQVQRSKVHPIQFLSALKTYSQGRSDRGDSTWSPIQAVVDALDHAFYASFQSAPRGLGRTLLALDISGSMFSGEIAGIKGLHPAMAAGAMAMVTAAVEPNTIVRGFTTGPARNDGRYIYAHRSNTVLEELALSPRRRLDDNLAVMQAASYRMGGTDCAMPMQWAIENRVPIDTFVVYTDNETYAGHIHPSEALADYRRKFNQRAKLIVVGMTATNFTIAKPGDPGMMDIVGFDASAPALMADFAKA